MLENQNFKRIAILEGVNEDMWLLVLLKECFLLKWLTKSSIHHC